MAVSVKIWAEKAHTLNPEQWVHVWLINDWFASEDFGCCQVKYLLSVIRDEAPLEDFALELCDSNGEQGEVNNVEKS